MQNGKLPADAAMAGVMSITANTPIAIKADKHHRIVSSQKEFERCRHLQTERSAWLASIHVRAADNAVSNARVAMSPLQ
jgi:hypothetical protein